MRRKKHKHTRKSVAFYKINYGFREPFKILLDGNFIHAALAANILHLDQLLARLLGGDVKLLTTPCVNKELQSLGQDFAAAAKVARQHQLHKCEHAPAQLPSDCLLAVVGRGNPDHWWVATQDKALQAELSSLKAVPVLFASVNGLHLAEAPEQAKTAVAAGQAAAQALPQHELLTEALKDLDQLRPKDDGWKKFRRKKVKGPNPLAMKKKRKQKCSTLQQAPLQAAAEVAGPADELTGKKRKRKKRSTQAASLGEH